MKTFEIISLGMTPTRGGGWEVNDAHYTGIEFTTKGDPAKKARKLIREHRGQYPFRIADYFQDGDTYLMQGGKPCYQVREKASGKHSFRSEV